MWPKVSTLWPQVFNLSESDPGHGKLKTRRHGGRELDARSGSVYTYTICHRKHPNAFVAVISPTGTFMERPIS
jgi:hypothetical protein